MVSGGFDSHDNNEFFRQQKVPIHEVIEHYNVPRPIKLRWSDNLQMVQDISREYAKTKRLNNNKLLSLVYTAKDGAALNPIAYYLIHSKSHNFNDTQADKAFAFLSPQDKLDILKKVATMNPILSTLEDATIDYLKTLTTSQKILVTQLDKAFNSLPIVLKREALSFVPPAVKKALVTELIKPNYSLAFLDRKQKDFLLGELLASEFQASAQMNKFKLALALQKYPESQRDARLAHYSEATLQKALKPFYEGQFNEEPANIIMLFLDGNKEDLRKYSKVIEDSKARNELQVPQTQELKAFFERMVTLNISTQTRVATLHPGVQSEAIIPLPAITQQGKTIIGPRLVVTQGTKVTDLGDANNALSSMPIAGRRGEYEVNVEMSDVYKGMHQVCHAMKLNHFDEMFFNPEELKARQNVQKIQIPGFSHPAKLPSQPSPVPVQQNRVMAMAA